MAAKPNNTEGADQNGQTTTEDIPLTCLEESLLSLEKMDRSSPELWPERMPGVSEFASQQNSNQSPPPWNKDFTNDDLLRIQHLNSLSTSNLIMEVKKLHDIAYQLGLDEAREMTRGKLLNIFGKRRPR